MGVALALVAGAIHLALSSSNLIPGEVTATPAFALMGIGFLGTAALIALTSGDLLIVAPVYAISLVLAWVFTRGQNPIELYGLVCQAAEIGLAIVGILLFRRSSAVPAPAARS